VHECVCVCVCLCIHAVNGLLIKDFSGEAGEEMEEWRACKMRQ